MVIAIFGESCTGKSFISDRLKERLSAEVYTGKDYLRLDKQEVKAVKIFKKLLSEKADSDENIIYVISEKEQLSILPKNCIRILVTADIEVIKERFSKRMAGRMPKPVSEMLERKHGMFDNEENNIHIVSGEKSIDEIYEDIILYLDKR